MDTNPQILLHIPNKKKHRYKSTNTSHTLDDIRLVFSPTCEQINVQQKYKIQYKQNILNFFVFLCIWGIFGKFQILVKNLT